MCTFSRGCKIHEGKKQKMQKPKTQKSDSGNGEQVFISEINRLVKFALKYSTTHLPRSWEIDEIQAKRW